MFWYLVICILMLYPLSIVYAGNISDKKTQGAALAAACFVLWFFMAMRGTSVGTDTKYYSYVFTQFADIPLSRIFSAVTYATDSEMWSFDFEPGYRLFNKLVSWFSASPQAITICNSTVIMVLQYRLIRRNSPDCLLSIWLYITLGIYQTQMNVTRNAIAILIAYHGFRFLQQKRSLPYVLCCLVAASFHKAALVFIPLYWLIHRINWSPKRIAGCILLATAVGIGFPLIAPVLNAVLPAGLTKYFTSTNSKLESVMVGVLHLALFVLIFLLLNRQERAGVFSRCRIGITMFTLNLCCFGLGFGIGYAARLAALFGPYMVLFVPQMLSMTESKGKRRKMTWIVAAVCGVQYILRLCVNNIGGTIPYEFFW